MFTAFEDSSILDFNQEEIVPVKPNITADEFVGATSCINSGVVGSTFKNRTIQDLETPITIKFVHNLILSIIFFYVLSFIVPVVAQSVGAPCSDLWLPF